MRTLIVIAATALLAVGCSNSADTAQSPPAETAAPALSDQQTAPERVTLDVTIENGQVTPTNQQLQAAVNEPIVINVTSDAADELHVHATPEHTFSVKPEAAQSFQFTVEVPGKVDVELHDLDRTVATITVR